MERHIVHIDVNSFAVSVERVVNARLRDRPVIVSFPAMDRAVVQSTSLEARHAGIYRGMTLQKALRLCRDVTVIPPNEPLYSRAMQAMMKIVSQFTPITEPMNYGHAYLDITGTRRLFGITTDTAVKIQREIRSQLYLPTSLGLAGNKMVSKIASEVIVPGGVQQVEHGTERQFIAPLKVHHLPAIGQAVKKQLLDLNIRLIEQISSLSLPHLTMIFGRTGLKLHRAANGIDDTPVWPPQQLPNVYEQHTLAEDSNDLNVLRSVLFQMTERAGRRLRTSRQTARKLVLEIYYADHREASGQKRFPSATNADEDLFFVADELFKKILTRRIRVRKLAVRFFQLAPVSAQLSLFSEAPQTQKHSLTSAIDRIRDRFGEDAVKFWFVN